MTRPAVVRWTEQGEARSALWRSENGAPAPRHIADADDRTVADEAYGLACQGTALLWRGDFQNARQMLLALGRRADRRPRRSRNSLAPVPSSAVEAFNLYRQGRSQRARTLNSLLVPLDETYTIPLARAPDVRQACMEAYGEAREPSLISLRALLGVIGAHEWRVRGIEIAAAGGRIHPHYGVFAPIRHEYIDLVASAPLPATLLTGGAAFDIGTGTGVLAAVLARRGAARVIATDLDPRAVACARENLETLGWAQHVEVVEADLFHPGAQPSQCAILPGCRHARVLRWRAQSMTRKAACCRDFWTDLPRILNRAVRAGSFSRTWRSIWDCDPGRLCTLRSQARVCKCWAGTRCGPRTPGLLIPVIACTLRVPPK